MNLDQQPLVSVIVVNWNGQQYLQNCFASLEQQTYSNIEIILADNASTDSSVDVTRQHFPRVIIHRLPENMGYTGGNNAGARVAKGKYLFFLNNDTRVDAHCLSRLVQRAESHSALGVLGCRELTYEGESLISEGVSADIFGYPCDGKKIFYADGAALFIRCDLFSSLNGFDSRHFACFEDLDISWRARLRGYRVVCEPTAIIYHKIGGTSNNEYGSAQYVTTPWRRKNSERNNLRNLLKNYSVNSLFFILPIYLMLNLMEFVFLCALGKFKIAADVYLKSWAYNLRILPDTLGERKIIQQTRKVSDWAIMKNMEWKVGKISSLMSVGIPKFTK